MAKTVEKQIKLLQSSITEKQNENDALKNKLKDYQKISAELEAVFQNSFDGITIVNKDGVPIKVNKAWDRLIGLKREEVIGRNVKELVDKGIFNDSVTLRVLETKKPATILQKMSSGKQAIVTGSPIFDEHGELYRIVINIRDVTELHQLQENLEKTKTLTERYRVQISQLRLKQTQEENIIADSKDMRNLLDLAVRVARVDSTILLLGESGVGKEVMARFIHSCSTRGIDQPFITVNCGAIPEQLLESELFGYETGAFTGARKEGKAGMFELANGGILFLDEIAELPLKLQVKLLHALQEKEIMRVGGTKPIKVNIRIITATNKDLKTLVRNGQFREDLYYRLNVVPMLIPPLRARREDILPLAVHYLTYYNKKYTLKKMLSNELMEELLYYDWPGNVRELANFMERMIVTSEKEILTKQDFPFITNNKFQTDPPRIKTERNPKQIQPLKESMKKLEHKLILDALHLCGTQSEAANALGISVRTLARKLKF